MILLSNDSFNFGGDVPIGRNSGVPSVLVDRGIRSGDSLRMVSSDSVLTRSNLAIPRE